MEFSDNDDEDDEDTANDPDPPPNYSVVEMEDMIATVEGSENDSGCEPNADAINFEMDQKEVNRDP